MFRLQTNGAAFTVIKSFPLVNVVTGTNVDGATPEAGLVLAGGTLYGTTSVGGSGGSGTVFSLGTNGDNFTVLKNFSALTDFTNSDGADPEAALIVSNGVLYGTTQYGGAGGCGSIFRVNINGTGFTNIYTFTGNSDGANPVARLLLSGSTLYGTTLYGGDSGYGTVFSLSTNGTDFATLHNFSGSEGQEGANPCAGLVWSSGQLFGTTQYGDSGDESHNGTVFRLDINGDNFTTLHSFVDSEGFYPDAELVLSSTTLYGVNGNPSGTVFQINTDGSGFGTVVAFDGIHRLGPDGGLVLSGGVLYGVTGMGGTGNSGLGNGVVYRVATDGRGLAALEVFSDFNGGSAPATGLVWSGNMLFGTTEYGGTGNQGTLFQIGTNGSGYAQAHEFSFPDNNGVNPDGYDPRAAMVLSAGMFYGTTRYGGTNGSGVVFRMNADGTGFTNLSSYPGGSLAALAVSGTNLYGVNDGIFKLSTNGSGRLTLYTFTGAEGNNLLAGLTVSGNNLYGTAAGGGASNAGCIFRLDTSGNNFPVLYSFTGGADGAKPTASLVLLNDMLYGTTEEGGLSGQGTVFSLGLSSVVTPIPLSIPGINNAVVLEWSDPAFSLQMASLVTGTYSNVPGASSPYTNAISGPAEFFRLRAN
ncbi:MAG TPA: choice-of-anchor tandem repeat GloVer-containing protein [Verrucomicrobiae bacterium]|nr:choice-of-anchor tandem repeat GloVer-containing protein [Verrucomicrobiae bacterium]